MAIFKPHTVFVNTGDHHCNSTRGLSAIEMMTEDGGTYRANKAQLWILNCFEDFARNIEKHVKNGIRRNKLKWVINGEAVENEHHETKQICTGNPVIQVSNAEKAIRPITALNPDAIWVNRGSKAHSGPSGCLDEMFARNIGAVPVYDNKPPEENIFSRYSLLLEVEEVIFEIAHTGKFSGLPWSGPNVLNRISVEQWVHYTTHGWHPPHIIIRNHTHHFGTSGQSQDIKIFTVSCPSWQLSTEHSEAIAPFNFLDIGGWIFICNSGKYEPIPITYSPPGPELCKA